MKQQDIINTILDQHLKKKEEKLWKKNVKGTLLLTIYFIINPLINIMLIIKGHWIISILYSPITFLGIGAALGGRKFTLWLMMQTMKLKGKLR